MVGDDAREEANHSILCGSVELDCTLSEIRQVGRTLSSLSKDMALSNFIFNKITSSMV